MRELDRLDPVAVQERTLLALVRERPRRPASAGTIGFAEIRSVADFQRRVPLRTYEDLWKRYLKDHYPVFDDLTWPGTIPLPGADQRHDARGRPSTSRSRAR